MNIEISDYNDGNVYIRIADASSAQVAAYVGCEIINIDNMELFKNTTVMDTADNTLHILVSEGKDES